MWKWGISPPVYKKLYGEPELLLMVILVQAELLMHEFVCSSIHTHTHTHSHFASTSPTLSQLNTHMHARTT